MDKRKEAEAMLRALFNDPCARYSELKAVGVKIKGLGLPEEDLLPLRGFYLCVRFWIDQNEGLNRAK